MNILRILWSTLALSLLAARGGDGSGVGGADAGPVRAQISGGSCTDEAAVSPWPRCGRWHEAWQAAAMPADKSGLTAPDLTAPMQQLNASTGRV